MLLYIKAPVIPDLKNENHRFRFRLSPENGSEIDMEKFTRKKVDIFKKRIIDSGHML